VLGASFGLSAATWVALGILAGFDGSVTLFGLTLRLAWLLPIAVDGYVVVALVLWMSPVPARVARFARTNTYAAAGVGVLAQSAYHALTVLAATGAAWRCVLAAVVGALPPAVTALAVHMRALIRRESAATGELFLDTEAIVESRSSTPAAPSAPNLGRRARAVPVDSAPGEPVTASRAPAASSEPDLGRPPAAPLDSAPAASSEPDRSRRLPAASLDPAPLDPTLLVAARKTADAHRAATGQLVDAERLRAELRVSATTAAELVAALSDTPLLMGEKR
jgi:hypothetical protein